MARSYEYDACIYEGDLYAYTAKGYHRELFSREFEFYKDRDGVWVGEAILFGIWCDLCPVDVHELAAYFGLEEAWADGFDPYGVLGR